ncbi:MAG: zinc ribbon domain-containing protein [Anaerolineae bacterium]
MADKFCSNCGNKVGPNDKFCNNCGQALAGQPGAAPQEAFTAPPAATESPTQEPAFAAPPSEPVSAFTPPPAEAQPDAFTAPPAEPVEGAFTPPPEQAPRNAAFTAPTANQTPAAAEEPTVPPPPAFTPPPAAAKVNVFGQAAIPQAPRPTTAEQQPQLSPQAPVQQQRFAPPPATAGIGATPPPPAAPGRGQIPGGAPAAPFGGAGAPPKKKSSTGCIIGGCVALIIIAAIAVILILAVFLPRFRDFGASLGGVVTNGTAVFRTAVSSDATPARVRTSTPATGATSGTVIYKDNFSNANSGWDAWNNSESVGGYENNAYAIEVSLANTFYWANAGQDLQNYILDIDTKKLSGVDNNHFGVILRYQDNKNFYMFGIASDGYYHFGYYANDAWTDLIAWTQSSAINAGSSNNHITIKCIGSDFTLSVNGEELGSVSDSSFSAGDIGLFVGAIDETPVKISFDNLVVTAAK